MRRYVIFSTVCLALALYSISGSAISVAFPVITSYYDTSVVNAGWVLNSYQLVGTIMMPLAGKISDIFGRRSTFLISTLLFTLGSILCAIAPSIGWLIGFRVIQGIGGGGFLPSAAGIVSDEFPESRQRYIGLFTSIFPIGMIVGPNLGGWMIEAFGWRSIFWFNVPLGIVVLILARLLFRTGEKKSTDRNLDFIGTGLLFLSLLTFMLGLTELGSSSSIPWPIVAVLFFAGIAFMAAFIRREKRAKEPVIDLELLRKRPFLAANVYNILYGLTALGIFSLIPLYAVSIYNLSVFQSGLIMTSRSICIIIASTITSIALVRWGYRKPILIGTLITAFGLFLLSLQPSEIEFMGLHLTAIPLLLIILGVCGIGHGICTPASSNACIELMPEKVATITGLRGMFRQLGSVIGVAISTVIINTAGSIQYAFYVIMLGSAVIMLLSIPSIFAMPSSPTVSVQPAADKSRI